MSKDFRFKIIKIIAFVAAALCFIGLIITGVFAFTNTEIVNLNNQGNENQKDEKYDSASALYDRIVENNPDEVLPYFNKGLSLYKQGKFEEAINSFNEASALSGNEKLTAEILYNKGNSFFKKGEKLLQNDPEKAVKSMGSAIKSYKEALKKNPNFVEAGQNLEIVRLFLKKLKEQLKNQQKDRNSKGENQDNEKKSDNDMENDLKDLIKRQEDIKNKTEENNRKDDVQNRQESLKNDTEKMKKDFENRTQSQDEKSDNIQLRFEERLEEHLEKSIENQENALQHFEKNEIADAAIEQEKSKEELKKAYELLKKFNSEKNQDQQNGNDQEAFDSMSDSEESGSRKGDETANSILEEEKEIKALLQKERSSGVQEVERDW